jgi:hypothetical protein
VASIRRSSRPGAGILGHAATAQHRREAGDQQPAGVGDRACAKGTGCRTAGPGRARPHRKTERLRCPPRAGPRTRTRPRSPCRGSRLGRRRRRGCSSKDCRSPCKRARGDVRCLADLSGGDAGVALFDEDFGLRSKEATALVLDDQIGPGRPGGLEEDGGGGCRPRTGSSQRATSRGSVVTRRALSSRLTAELGARSPSSRALAASNSRQPR